MLTKDLLLMHLTEFKLKKKPTDFETRESEVRHANLFPGFLGVIPAALWCNAR